ncbi:hypothetical protein IAT38_003748 [Cryptococcus sp. DSM 104549]
MSYADLPSSPTIPVEPYRLSIPDKDVSDLKTLLELGRIPKETYESVSAQENSFGVTREWIVAMRDAWVALDWQKQEARINSQPQFKAQVENKDGLKFDIHFMALFSKRKDAVPVILSHGWPGCYLEFLPMLGLVREKYNPEDLPYHLIVPTLPGWLFSSPPPTDREFSVKDVAYLFDQLMRGLGFGSGYVAQGGDIGSFVTNEMGKNYDACKMIHLNFKPMQSPPPKIKAEMEKNHQLPKLTSELMLQGFQKFGYALEHGTRPSTIGITVGSNPISLLAWVGEKYQAAMGKAFNEEMVLTILSLYWYSDCFPSCIYPYRYFMGIRRNEPSVEKEYQPCPTGYSLFPREMTPAPVKWAEEVANIVWSKTHDEGGHFAALEVPELLLGDVEDFVKSNWSKYGGTAARL